MKEMNEISIREFDLDVSDDGMYLVYINNYKDYELIFSGVVKLIEGSFWEVIEYFREKYCDKDLSLGVDEILEIVEGVIEDEDDIRIFIK